LPAEEQQQPKDQDIEDKANEEYTPLSDAEDEKMYRDADEVESFRIEAPVLTGRLRALLEHLGITIAPRYRIKEVPRSGRVEFKAIAEIFFGSRVLCRHKGPAFKTSHSNAIADAAWQAITSLSVATRVDCRTLSTTSVTRTPSPSSFNRRHHCSSSLALLRPRAAPFTHGEVPLGPLFFLGAPAVSSRPR
jgi:hypothetical protein